MTYYAGLDLARVEDFTVIVVMNSSRRVVWADRFHRIDWSLQIDRIRVLTDYFGGAQITGRWLGTNDTGWAGGEASGTANVVQTEALEYDSNDDDANSYLTKRTLYVESGTSGQRVTTYANDVFGRVLLPHEAIAT